MKLRGNSQADYVRYCAQSVTNQQTIVDNLSKAHREHQQRCKTLNCDICTDSQDWLDHQIDLLTEDKAELQRAKDGHDA